MAAFHRPEERQMAILYGKQGRLIEDLDRTLARPGTQAILLAMAALTVAAGCFYLARIAEEEAKPRTSKKTAED